MQLFDSFSVTRSDKFWREELEERERERERDSLKPYRGEKKGAAIPLAHKKLPFDKSFPENKNSFPKKLPFDKSFFLFVSFFPKKQKLL